MTLFIRLLGPVEISLDDTPLPLKGYKPVALLAYLLLTHQAHSREHLVDLLYDGAADPRASLRWTLNQLQQTIGADYLAADRQQIGFNFESDYWLDVEAFLGGETTLYRAEFLEGVYIRDAHRFMDWAFFERERLHQAYQNALASQLAERQRRGDYQGVLEIGHQLLRLDNLREEWYRALMQAYTLVGHREAALAQYDICRRMLRQELGVEPDKETTVLYKQIQAGALTDLRSRANLPIQSAGAGIMNDMLGRTLGQYQIIEQIGQGGMATIFKAYQPSLDRSVALKILTPLLARQADFGERFEREAKAIAKLNHPNILPIFDFGQADSYSFLVMRHIEGAQTLKEVMKQPLTLLQIADLIAQVAQALDYAHQQGIIHRDVKPSNVLMDGEWALLSDFGLAKMTETSVKLTGTGVGIGTPAYMSPEQGQGRLVDHRTDIYALGIILFEMLTGQIPHDAETPFGIVLRRATEPLPLPRTLNPETPEPVERVVLKALASDPNDRFDSAGALAEALKTAVSEIMMDIDRPTVASIRLRPTSVGTAPLGTMEALSAPAPMEPGLGLRQKITALFAGQDEPHELRNRQALLKLVQDFWIKGVLENSLHGAALIELGLETRPEAVAHPWQTVLQTPAIAELSIPVGTKMRDVFDELGDSLLILGEPGAGKTTMLLELARDLIRRAEGDLAQPLPVVFNLTSWTEARPAIADWLADELQTKYNIPRKVAQAWLENEAFVLLLDGLDEVPLSRREACLTALNTFHQNHGLTGLVVCSRTADYEVLTTRLNVRGAVRLQPLTPQQVDTYLSRGGDQLVAVRQAWQSDATLQELAQSPLLLSLMTLAYQGKSVQELPALATVEARRKHLLDTYVKAMFKRRGADQAYPPAQTVSWLAWLAQNMVQHSQSLFLIERLQPSWLPTRGQSSLYALLMELIFGLTIGLVVGLSSAVGTPGVIIGGLLGVLIAVLTGGLINKLAGVSVKPIWPFNKARKKWVNTILGVLCGGLISILFVVLLGLLFLGLLWIAGVEMSAPMRNVWWILPLQGTVFGLIGGGVGGLIAGVMSDPFKKAKKEWVSRMLGLLCGGLVGNLFGVFLGLFIMSLFWMIGRVSKDELGGLIVGVSLFCGLVFALPVGGMGLMIGGLIGDPQRIVPVEVLKWSWAKARRGLGVGLLVALLGAICFVIVAVLFVITFSPGKQTRLDEPVFLLGVSLLLWLLYAIVCVPFGGMMGGLRSEEIETTVRPNQGIWQSGKNALIITPIVLLASLLFYALSNSSIGLLSFGLLLGLNFGLIFGGRAFIQHFMLRSILYRAHCLPWRYTRFLNYAAERVFLRKVGGGYIFIHRLFLEYFAGLDRNEIQQLTQDL